MKRLLFPCEETFFMFSYYTSVILMSLLALVILSILIQENGRLTNADKRLLHLTCVLIAASALAEWFGVRLDGREDIPHWVLRVVKCVDYILTPLAGGSLVVQMHIQNRWQKIMMWILAANTVFQIVACFGGWMVQIDEQNHYSHGPLYGVYIIVSLMIIGLVIIQFLIYGKSFGRRNRTSLYSIMGLVVAGILIQELVPGGCRTAYLGLTLGAALMFIHFTEYSQLAMEEQLQEKQNRIDRDALTGVFSRMAFSDTLKELDSEEGGLPEGFAAFTIDINGLKSVNDRLGHDAGDELICGAAECIERVFDTGRCYRTGGDEFVVLTQGMDAAMADMSMVLLNTEAEEWHGEKVGKLELSSGYALAADNPDLRAPELVHEADLAMYEAKAAYYQRTGRDRRRKR